MTKRLAFVIFINSISLVCFSAEKKTILLVFPQFENLGLTGRIVQGGVEMAAAKYPDIAKETQLEKLEPDKNVKIMTEQVTAAIQKHHPIAIIGAITSNVALALSQVAESEKIPFITPFATHPAVTRNKIYTFRACFDDDYQAQKLAEFAAKDLKRKNAVILVNASNAYSMGIKTIFEKDFAKLNGKVIKVINFESEKDFTKEMVSSIAALKPDLILLPSYQIEAAAILSHLTNGLPKNVAYLGPDSWGGGRLFHKVFDDRGAEFKGYYAQHISNERSAMAKADIKAAQVAAALGEDPAFKDLSSMTAPLAIGLDSGKILFEALKLQKSNPKLTIVEAIHQVSFEGITGPISFKGVNTPSGKPLFIYVIDKHGEHFLKEVK